MKQLFWKEWHELRLLPLGTALCTALLTFGIAFFQMAFYPNAPDKAGANVSVIAAFGMWLLSAIVAGCGLFSQEVGSGSLIFLDALPVGRGRIWWTKTLTAAGVFFLTLLACALAWALAASMAFFGGVSVHSPVWLWRDPRMNGVIYLFVLIACSFFTVAVAVSAFLDRAVSAFVMALLVSVGGWGALYDAILYNLPISAQSAASNGSLVAFFCLASIFVCLVTSFYTFTRGESLRSPKRFLVGSISGLISLTVAGLALVFRIGHLMSAW